MSFFNRLTAVFLTALLIGPAVPLQARTRKGDRYLAQGRAHEEKKEWDAALEAYEKALSEDPADINYQMAAQKSRFQASQAHTENGLKVRAQGQLGEALLEFQKGFAINPGSAAAEQEILRTQEMIQRERRRVEETGKESPPEERALTPVEQVKKETVDRINRMRGVPELKPLNPAPINLTLRAQPVKVLFETIGKVAGLNVLWDPEYQPPGQNKPMNVDFENSTIEEALDYLAVVTKSYWKPLSPNTIFITNDNPNKRRDFAEMVTKTFYLSNINAPQELQEISNAVRSVSEIARVVAFGAQNAIIVRGEADQVALAEKMIHDLDKPRPEVVIDVLVIEASTTFTRQLTAAIASTGLNVPANFTPRPSIQVQSTSSSSSSSSSSSTSGTTTPTSSTSGSAIPLSQLGHIASADFSTTLPSALLQATLSDARSKVLQAPQIRTVDNIKAELKIGQREPTATGSFQPGIGGVGINPLVNTQFTYIDVGVNVTLQARVHDNGDVSMHIDLDISNVGPTVNLGGINQPIIVQRKVSHDIRIHEGEVNLLGGLTQTTDTKTVTGIPGLSSIPIFGKLFSGDSVEHDRDELMIAIIPHVVRRPQISPENLRGVAVGNAQTVKIGYAPKAPEPAPAPPAAPQPGAAPAAAGVIPGSPANPPATAAVPAAPAMAPPATAPPATASPATAPPATAPPATAPPATAPPATAPREVAKPGGDAQSPAAGRARLRFSPAQVDTSVSNSITAVLSLEGGTDVASAPLQIQFDPKILRLNDIARGDTFFNDGVFTKSILNDTGTATVQLSRLPGTPGVSGSGVIVTLNFQAIGKGAATVTVPNFVVKNSAGQVVASGSPQFTVNVK